MRVAVVVILIVLVLAGGLLVWRAQSGAADKTAPPAKQKLYMMVPQGVFLPFNKVLSKFEAAHPNVEVEMVIDTPEAMAQMVEENDRKPDIFISPGGHELEVLRQKGYIDPSTMVSFGSYKLAILVPKANPGNVKKIDDLLNPGVKTISISDPDLNAACYAARLSLQNAGLWDKLKPKVKVTGCCMSSFKWILDGRAQANVQFMGCPMDEKAAMAEESKVSIACEFPAGTYYTPRNAAGILKTCKERKLAEEFLAFLTSPEMVKLMLDNRLRDDAKLGTAVGPWGPAQETNPVKTAKAGT